MRHVPVLAQEVVQHLGRSSCGLYVDGTVGLGGHARLLLEKFSSARLIGMDCDENALEGARENLFGPLGFSDRVTLVRGNFAEMRTRLAHLQGEVGGILLDVGVSSIQLDDAERGFSFGKDGPLDMRMDKREQLNARQLVARASEQELTQILERWGEEPYAKAVARGIVVAREQKPIHTTGELAGIVSRSTRHRNKKIHPATLTFQALRIAVNRELHALEAAIPAAMNLLQPTGRLAIISFHRSQDSVGLGTSSGLG
eukprot:TRINITY_DN4764_c0_g1_i1.p1 TRINITY_DN4764_c0_g1~~TRINITY_DN4764_c0_g1_i1.p1  ORF type:complete len:257 (+),score=46.46 TRINITY_DN4764_c0_g1_i1:206-976(+)